VKRSPIRRVSPQRAAEQRIYTKRRRVFLAERERCEWPLGCEQAATEVHHRRGRVGALYLAVEHWSALCHDHHTHCTQNPAEAYALGISERRVSA
jgi:hypothetical protein